MVAGRACGRSELDGAKEVSFVCRAEGHPSDSSPGATESRTLPLGNLAAAFSRDTTLTSAATQRGSNATPDSSWSRRVPWRSTRRHDRPAARRGRRRHRRPRGSASRDRAPPTEAARIAAAVEPLVVVEDEAAHLLVEAAQLDQELLSLLRMLLDDLVLVVVERARLLQDGVRNRELAHVVQEAADRQVAEPRPREPESLADLDGERGDAARVLLGRAVLLAEPHHDRPHAGAEERLFGVARPRRPAGRRRAAATGCRGGDRRQPMRRRERSRSARRDGRPTSRDP